MKLNIHSLEKLFKNLSSIALNGKRNVRQPMENTAGTSTLFDSFRYNLFCSIFQSFFFARSPTTSVRTKFLPFCHQASIIFFCCCCCCRPPFCLITFIAIDHEWGVRVDTMRQCQCLDVIEMTCVASHTNWVVVPPLPSSPIHSRPNTQSN